MCIYLSRDDRIYSLEVITGYYYRHVRCISAQINKKIVAARLECIVLDNKITMTIQAIISVMTIDYVICVSICHLLEYRTIFRCCGNLGAFFGSLSKCENLLIGCLPFPYLYFIIFFTL